MSQETYYLDNLLDQGLSGRPVSPEKIMFLLNLNKDEDLEKLFQAARDRRERYFGQKIFLYGFIYFSTWCRNDCTFCYYRRSNPESNRYRKNVDETIEAAVRLKESGVHLIDLTLGEDPFYQRQKGFDDLADLISQVKRETKLPVMISPGVVPEDALKKLAAAGADWYACYQETHSKVLFNKLRIDQSYDARLHSKKMALKAGMLVEEGLLTGVGESLSDILISLEHMSRMGARQVRVMSFVPQKGTPMEGWRTSSRVQELKVIAVMRLLFPDRLIPASLDVDGIDGLQDRIKAGANVVTSLIPPQLGFAGVAQNSKDINEGYRTVYEVIPILEQMGLTAASPGEYRSWVNREKDKLRESNYKTKGA
ncbi:methylornithine synthase PylB [Candidatus Formimonas warabiya]|uniref:methylornithine synthase PylB n=1 Tax=Formimonas warabiya TaxID=1761012 RepID=UPI003002E507